MSTEFPYLQVTTPEQKRLAGKQDKGTRIYRREGTYKESGEWCVAIDEVFNEQFVSPGGVCMFVPASRAAVHKRIKEGRLTALCFHVVHDERTFFGKVRKAKATPFVYIPVSECKAWGKELEEKRGKIEGVKSSDWNEEFLDRDPEDRGNRKVRYTDKHLEQDQKEQIVRELEENARYRRSKKSQGKSK